MRARSSTLRFQPFGAPTPDSVDVRVEPEREGSGWVGRVVIAGTPTLERQVHGERCEDVVAALALITVLRLEPNEARSVASASRDSGSAGEASPNAPSAAGREAPSSPTRSESPRAGDPRNPNAASSAEPSRAPSVSLPARPATPMASAARGPSEAPAAVAPAGPDSGEREPDASPAASGEREGEREAAAASSGEHPAPEAGAPEPIARAPDVEPGPPSLDENEPPPDRDEGSTASEPEPARQPWQWPVVRAGVAAEVGYATVPEGAPFGLIEGELRFGEDISSWATALSFAYARSTSEVRADLGTTPVSAELDITLLSAELALCPPAVAATSVWFRACAGLRGGGVHVVITPDDASLGTGDRWRPWIALAPALQVGVPLSERWALRGVFELAMQLVRDRFGVLRTSGIEREPITLYRPGAASFEFSLGFGYTF